MKPYEKIMSPEEKSAAFMSGVAIVTASAKMYGDEELAKSAQDLGGALRNIGTLGDMSSRLLVTAALMTGVPVGIVAHVVARRMGDEQMKEKQLNSEIGYYRGAASGIERELSRQGVKMSQVTSTVPGINEGGQIPAATALKTLQMQTFNKPKLAPAPGSTPVEEQGRDRASMPMAQAGT